MTVIVPGSATAPSARSCARCLFYEGMPRWLNPQHVPARLAAVALDDDGVCNVCRAYEREHDEVAHELAEVAVRERAKRGVVVALSGGKDSVAALWRARRDLAGGAGGRGVVACLYDNGFIPPQVVERARDLCARLDVELAAPPPDRAFAAVVEGTRADGPSPCDACARNVSARLLALCDERDISLIVTGTNYWAAWDERENGAGPTPVTRWVTPLGTKVVVAHLPYLLWQKRADTLALVREAGVDVAHLPGVSSNCRVPALVQDRVAGALGHVPELEDLSLEVIVGHITRAEALAELRDKAPSHAHLLLGQR